MGPEKPIQFVGAFHAESAKRSRARRMTGKAFEIDLALEGTDGPAKAPAVPIPDDLRDTFTNAYYRSLSWRKTKWLGEPVPNPPSDLHAYQQLLSEVKPDWVIDLTGNPSGRALLPRHHLRAARPGQGARGRRRGRRGRRAPARPQPAQAHRRLRRGARHPSRRCARSVGKDPKALVIIGNRHSGERTQQLFEAYCPMVPVKLLHRHRVHHPQRLPHQRQPRPRPPRGPPPDHERARRVRGRRLAGAAAHLQPRAAS